MGGLGRALTSLGSGTAGGAMGAAMACTLVERRLTVTRRTGRTGSTVIDTPHPSRASAAVHTSQPKGGI
jgi:hypothetical protein